MTASSSIAVPTIPGERLRSLDVLRGFAVLGILIMNIQSFSMISAAYINPTAYGDLSGANLWVWILSHLLVADKFMSIFSMLFGRRRRADGRTDSEVVHGKPDPVHYRRNVLALLFGLVHANLISYGDILVAYSLCGMLVFAFRRLSAGKLVLAAALSHSPRTSLRAGGTHHPVLDPGIICADAAIMAAGS